MTSAALTMSDAVHERVVSMIARCELQPGRWVTEKEIVALTGFGLAPVRAALGRLRYEGLVEPVARVGYRVRPLDAADVEDLFLVWGLVVPTIIERAYRLVSDEDVAAHLAGLGDDAATLAPGGERRMEFWIVARQHIDWLAEKCGSPRLQAMFDRLRIDVQRCYALVALMDGATDQLDPPRLDLLGWLQRREAAPVVRRLLEVHENARGITLEAVARADEAGLWARKNPAVG